MHGVRARRARGAGPRLAGALGDALAAHVRVTFAVRGEAPRRLACLQDGSGEFGEVGNLTPPPSRATTATRSGLSRTVDVRPDGAGPVLCVAGHNLFKQAPGLGRALAAAATGEPLGPVLRPEARLGVPE